MRINTISEGDTMHQTARAHTAQMLPPARLPATTIRRAPWQDIPASEWTRDDVLDAAARVDELDSVGVARVAAELAEVAQEIDQLRAERDAAVLQAATSQRLLVAEMAEAQRLRALHARIAIENHDLRVTVSYERMTVTLNERVRGMVDSGEVPDVEVIDVEHLDGTIGDRTPTRLIPVMTQAQIAAAYGGGR